VWLASLLGGFEPKRIQDEPEFFYDFDGIVLEFDSIAQQEVA
jgi:hypothetical protein